MNLGVVVIGRNEEPRMARTLRAATSAGHPCVYVDSNSTDRSVAIAQELGVSTISLDAATPLSAARGRNAGARWLLERYPDLEALQFVDGDTALEPQWLESGFAELKAGDSVGVVCGVLSEYNHDRSPIRRLCHLEWQDPVGDVETCGGIMMVDAEAFHQARGFDETFIVGEEREFCTRLRAKGLRVVRIENPMGIHDSGIDSFGRWWVRAIRSGEAGAQGLGLAGREREPSHIRRVISAIAWACGIPTLAIVSTILFGPLGLSWLALYVLLWMKIARRFASLGRGTAFLLATALLLAKWAEAIGIFRYLLAPRAWRKPEDKQPVQPSHDRTQETSDDPEAA